MNRKIIYIASLILATAQLSLVTSCNKWLDVKPRAEVDREALYNSEIGFKSALVGCYTNMKQKNGYGENMTMTTMEYLAQHWVVANTNDQKKLHNFDYQSDYVKGKMKSMYTVLYNTIAQSNDLLHYLELNGSSVIADPNLYNLIKGEALAIRAFCHLDVLRIFGQIPQNATQKVSLPYAEKFSKENPTYYAYDEYVAKLEADLLASAELLEKSDPILKHSVSALNKPYHSILTGRIPNDFFAYRQVRFNYYAVKALQARMYLYIGNKSKAYEAAKVVIDAKVEGLKFMELNGSPDYATQSFTLPSETLVGLNTYKLDEIVNPLFNNTNNVLNMGSTETKVLKDIFNNETANNRRDLWYSISTASGVKQWTLKKFHQNTAEISEYAISIPLDREFIPLIRLSEVYLIAIESSDLATANQLFKYYRTFRGLQPIDFTDNNMLIEQIKREYRYELWAEGQMFYTYKRLGENKMLWRTAAVTEAHYIVPLPETEYNSNNL